MRAIIVVVVGALLTVQIVRTTAVAKAPTRAAIGARLWPSHPTILIDRTMAEIGARARVGGSLPPQTLRQVEDIARKAPLAPEPFLIKGALAQIERKPRLAEQLLVAARTRDPRSVPARYFLADRYLRTERTALALAEIAVLSRLFPEGRSQFGPALAAFARMPRAVPQLRSLFRSSPEMEPLVLSRLAEDVRNTDLILALWGGRQKIADPLATEWQSKLVNKLIEQGQFAKAFSVWRLFSGAGPSQRTVFNPGFRKMSNPPPFNWKFASSDAVVESAPGDRLQVIYFGRNDAILAEQLLLLPPGEYQLSMDIGGSVGEAAEIAWALTCVPGGNSLLRLPVVGKGRVMGRFSVAQGCSAQRLQLKGSAGELPESQAFTVGKLTLTRPAHT